MRMIGWGSRDTESSLWKLYGRYEIFVEQHEVHLSILLKGTLKHVVYIHVQWSLLLIRYNYLDLFTELTFLQVERLQWGILHGQGKVSPSGCLDTFH